MGDISAIDTLPFSVQLRDTYRSVFYLLFFALVIAAAGVLDGYIARIAVLAGAGLGLAMHWRATSRSVMLVGPAISRRKVEDLLESKLRHVAVDRERTRYRPSLPRALYFDTQVLELRVVGAGIELSGPKMVLRFIRRRLLGETHPAD